MEATSGAVGALVSTTILYPLDTCKTKYQVENRAHHNQKYRHALKDVESLRERKVRKCSGVDSLQHNFVYLRMVERTGCMTSYRCCSLRRSLSIFTKDGNESGAAFILRILTYLETPQYLRKDLFPKNNSLRFVGLLPPLDAPHHLRKHE